MFICSQSQVNIIFFNLIFFCLFEAPISVYGEGTYSLTGVKEMKTTAEYLGLGEDIRKCQNREPFEECTTRNYIDSTVRKCNCVPYALKGLTTNMVIIPQLILTSTSNTFLCAADIF